MDGAVCARPISIQSPIDVDQTTLTDPTRGAASMLGGKRLNFIWDEQSRGWCEADIGGAVYARKVYGGPEGMGGPRVAGQRENYTIWPYGR